MTKKWKLLLTIMTALSGGAALLSIMFLFLTGGKENAAASSIAVIGGADGPTSIFLVGTVGSGLPLYALTAVLAVMTLALFLAYKRKK